MTPIILAMHHVYALMPALKKPNLALTSFAAFRHMSVGDAPKKANHIDPHCGFNALFMHAQFSNPTPRTGVATIDLRAIDQSSRRELLNSSNSVHGGVQFGLHDLAACHVLSRAGYSGATKTASVSYVEGASFNTVDQLEAVAKIEAIRGNSAFITSELIADKSKLISMAQMVFSVWS